MNDTGRTDHAWVRPSTWGEGPRWAVAAVGSCCCLALVVLLVAGNPPRPIAIVAFVAACVCVALIVIALPSRIRAKYGVVATAFVSAAGVLALFADLGGPEEDRINTAYAADLLVRGPFNGDPSPPLIFVELRPQPESQGTDVTGAVVQVDLDFTVPAELMPFPGYDGPSAHLFLFRSSQDAEVASQGELERYTRQYAQFGQPQGTARAFNLFGNGDIIAGGVSGPVYCEGSISPDSTANIGLANELVASCLRYADDMVALAGTR
jgi:hypothetical protein